MSNLFYRAFEDRHRGSRDAIKARLGAYLPFLLPLHDAVKPTALDLGCGRGEWIELLVEHGFSARGVDLDEGMLAACRERGLQVQTQDALSSLRAQPDASLAVISAFHLVEHIPFDDVQELISESLRALQPGGLLIMETPNPENLVVATSGFYLDPSHLRPIPPMLLEFVVEFAGFPRHKVLRLQESAALHGEISLEPINVLNGVSPDFSVLAQKDAAPEVLALFDAAFAIPYGIELAELSHRYQVQQQAERAAIQGEVTLLEARVTLVEQSTASVVDRFDAHVTAVEQRAVSMVDRFDARIAEVERDTANLFGHALSVVDRTNEAMLTVQLNLTAALQREHSLADRSRELEQKNHALTVEAVLRSQELQRIQEMQALVEGRALHAEARVLQAEQRADEITGNYQDAVRLVQQSQGMQTTLEAAMIRTAAAEHALTLTYASTSWKLTAPLRFASRMVRITGLRSRLKSTFRRAAASTVREMMKNGRLSRLGMAVVARNPGLKAKLRRLLGTHVTAPYQQNTVPVMAAAAAAARHIDGTSTLTPRAASLLAKLQTAVAERKN